MAATVLTHYDIDEAVADSFPASDPPAWTPGVARPSPAPVDDTLGPVLRRRPPFAHPGGSRE